MNIMPGLVTRTREMLIHYVERAVELSAKLPGNPRPESRGGYLTVIDLEAKQPALIIPISEMPEEKMEKYFRLSQEKAFRLLAHPEHMSSFQSQHPELDEWPGAIRAEEEESIKAERAEQTEQDGVFRADDVILSFSGLYGLCDEAVCLAVAVKMRWLSGDRAASIAALSRNPFYQSLVERL